MIDSTELRTNKTIPESVYKAIDQTVYRTAANISFARDILYTRVTNEGITKQALETLTMGTGSAYITMTLKDGPKDAAEITSSQIRVAILKSDNFYISPRNMGKNLDTAAAASMAIAVMNKENVLAIAGSSKYGISGVYALAGNTESTSLDFGTAGNAVKKVRRGISMIQAAGYDSPQGWNLLLSTTQYDQLGDNVISGIEFEFESVKRLLGPKGRIINAPTTVLADGTGLILPVNTEGVAELYVPQDLTTNLVRDRFGGVDGIVYEAITPRVMVPNALCKLTNI